MKPSIFIGFTIVFLIISLSFGSDIGTNIDVYNAIVNQFKNKIPNTEKLSIDHKQIVAAMEKYFKNYETINFDRNIVVSNAISEDKKNWLLIISHNNSIKNIFLLCDLSELSLQPFMMNNLSNTVCKSWSPLESAGWFLNSMHVLMKKIDSNPNEKFSIKTEKCDTEFLLYNRVINKSLLYILKIGRTNKSS